MLLSRWLIDIYTRFAVRSFGCCGRHVEIRPGLRCREPARVRLGDYIHIGPCARIYAEGGLAIGDNVIIGPQVSIYTANHRYDADTIPYDTFLVPGLVTIDSHVWIAGNVVITPGVTIGEGAVVGAGSVVVGAVPPLAVAVGNPARVVKYRDSEKYSRAKEAGRFYMAEKFRSRCVLTRLRGKGTRQSA